MAYLGLATVAKRFRGGFVRRATLIALAAGFTSTASAQLYVSSSETDSVKEYSQATGAYIRDFVPPGSGALDTPWGLTFGPDGNLYVSSFGNSQINRYSGTTGASLGPFVPSGFGNLDGPRYLTFGPDRNLYVSSYNNNQINRYDGTTGAPLGSFGNPADAAFAVQTFNPGPPADPRNTGITNPSGLAFGPGGNVYVGSEGTDSIKRIDATGRNVDGENGDFIASAGLPTGLVFDAAGNLYVGSLADNSIRRYDLAGNLIGSFTNDALQGPEGLVIGNDGLLYVSSFDNSSVVRFTLGGDFAGVFVAPEAGGLFLPTGLAFRPAGQGQVPEPSVLLLLGAGGMLGAIISSRRNRRRN